MKIIHVKEIQKILTDHFNIQLTLQSGEYYCFSLASSDFISVAEVENGIQYLGKGQIIMEKRNHEWYLLPSILHLIENIHSICIHDYSLIDKITHHESITLDHDSGTYLIRDKYDRIHALGTINNNQFVPVIDSGAFLRLESFSNNA